MKKTIFILLVLPLLVFAQQVKVLETKKITNAGANYYPRFSPDNSEIFVTAENYDGIKAIDIATGNERVINTYPGAGWNYFISDDGSNLVCRPYQFIDGMKYYSVVVQNLNDLSEKVLEKDVRNLPCVMPSKEGLAYVKEGKVSISNISEEQNKTENIFAYYDNWSIVIEKNGTKKEYKPFGDAIYIWISLSPDKSKLMFNVGNKGTFIADLNGNILVELGKDVLAPQWSPDGKWIIYMNETDDGLNYLTSDIFIVDAQGKNKIQLTNTSDELEMYPSWSSDGKQIAYNTLDGVIYISKLSFE